MAQEEEKDRRKPFGPLMAEHRVIEKAVKALGREAAKAREKGEIDESFIASVIDFFRTYADKCHHGKEEDILFRELEKKSISEGHRIILQRLIDEHDAARNMLRLLGHAAEKGDAKQASECMSFLAWMYPKHIELEDRHFFIPVMEYLSDDEQCCMVGEFFDFDRKQIHDKYRKAAEELEKG